DCAPNDPNDRTAIGDTCDDGNDDTMNDTIDDDCNCIGAPAGGGNSDSEIALSCPADLVVEAFLGEDQALVSWDLPLATTTCTTGGCAIDSLDGFDFMGVYNGNLYYVSEQPEYWLIARENCQNNGGDLVVIDDAVENRFITDAIGFNGSVLIGLNDMETEGKFRWVDGTEADYTNWEDGQPDNFMDVDRPENEDYAALHGWSNGKWADYNFYTQKHYVLEIPCASGIQSVVDLEQTTGENNGAFFPLGTTQVTYRAVDNCGTEQTCSFNVTVEGGRERCEATTNLALGQPARQSSTQSEADASRANDGNSNGVLYQNDNPLPTGSVSLTNWEQSPWWEVDLGDLYQISTINLFNRTDCCSDFLQDFYIMASAEPFVADDLNANLTRAGVVSYYQENAVGENASIGLNQSGRYVRIQLRGQGALALAEVEILGCAGNGLLVNDGASQLNFGGYLNEENVVQLYAQNYAPVGAENLVIEKADAAGDFQLLNERAENNAARQSISYQTKDEQPNEGDNFYRLKVIYQNGTFEYSPLVNVPFNPVSDFTVFPNPTSDYVDVYLKRFKNQDFNLLITNHLGIEIERFDFKNQQDRFIRLDVAPLQDGLYFITILRNGKTETRRLVVQKM
ncbi:MAG: lectin-like protein, partial [Saprospiraceae bacterium]